MLIHGKLEQSAANGPGERAVIWTQGCSLGCKGCQNPTTHQFSGIKEMDVYGLRDWVLGIPGIEGLTISGGEPMQQADGLYLLVTLIHEKRPDFSIGIFSGYTEKQLEEGRWKWHSRATGEWIHGDGLVWAEIKKHLDFAIMGRFIQDLRCMDKPLCGSRNQEVVFFTDRYSAKDVKPTMVEMIISANDIITTGFPPPPEEETGDLVHA